jgi:hypothetical protein
LHLLGRHVRRRADAADLSGFSRGRERSAEIRNLDVGILRRQDIRRFDIAVNHSISVGVIERLRAFEDDLDDLVHAQQILVLGVRLERAAFDVFHDKVAALIIRNGIEDGTDVRVRQFAGERGLGQEQLAKALAVLLVA